MQRGQRSCGRDFKGGATVAVGTPETSALVDTAAGGCAVEVAVAALGKGCPLRAVTIAPVEAELTREGLRWRGNRCRLVENRAANDTRDRARLGWEREAGEERGQRRGQPLSFKGVRMSRCRGGLGGASSGRADVASALSTHYLRLFRGAEGGIYNKGFAWRQ